MKKYLLYLCAAAPLCASAQENFHIKGKISGWKGKDSVFINYMDDQKQLSDSTVAINGRFEFRGVVTQPTLAYIRLEKPILRTQRKDSRKFYLEDGLISITGKDSIRYATVKGTKVNQDAEHLEKQTSPVLSRLVELRMSAARTPREAQQTDAFKGLQNEYSALLDSMHNVRVRFIREHPGSHISVETLAQIAGAQIDYAKISPLYNLLDEDIRNTPTGQELAERLAMAKKIQIGSVMPSFSSLDTARNPLNLQEVVKSGKLTLVDFWASWCGPCRAENPNVVKAFNAFHEKGFNIISVSLDDNADYWKRAIIKDGMPWYHVSGLQKWQEPVAQLFGINAVPDNFLLDENGKVIARGLRGQALYDRVMAEINK
ncbi:TlpA disulfide reductase family protein [Chitinophaga sp. XS-30]|uniref:TlpA disulfide reductase family protein n=1 Tax=Chitinophaga sp. XS-30 TaxID=2604421 RepID=UPI0011DE0DDD|nr:TlpA disulfide reductase family protein [Chitinophaga sp. XS-30]QEH42559.1 AhpC/TSA family protein [Chitinophaga sp. XS-30]